MRLLIEDIVFAENLYCFSSNNKTPQTDSSLRNKHTFQVTPTFAKHLDGRVSLRFSDVIFRLGGIKSNAPMSIGITFMFDSHRYYI